MLKKDISLYEPTKDQEFFKTTQEIFQNSNFTPSQTHSSKRIIFILGMPRSGTSLIEQILASHSQVYGAGELDFCTKEIYTKILENANFNTQDFWDIHQNYMTRMDGLGICEEVITDKMPHNFKYIGYILQAFSNAKIIHVNRDPMAVCWSLYSNYFTAEGLGFTYDMQDIADFYVLYLDFMAFWRCQYPNQIYDISYEALTQNQNEQTKALLEYCDLPWEQACLEFHQTKRAVMTNSSQQVKQKLYQGSSLAWKRYEKHLDTLKDRIKKLQ